MANTPKPRTTPNPVDVAKAAYKYQDSTKRFVATNDIKKTGPVVEPQKIKGATSPNRKTINAPVKESGLAGREVGKMDHQGGHGLQGGAISSFGGGGLPEETR